jgi:hypothetical protein
METLEGPEASRNINGNPGPGFTTAFCCAMVTGFPSASLRSLHELRIWTPVMRILSAKHRSGNPSENFFHGSKVD